MTDAVRAEAASKANMDSLHVSLDSATIDAGVGKRKLRSLETDGSLIYDEE